MIHVRFKTTVPVLLLAKLVTVTTRMEAAEPTVVHVKKNQTLNEAIADVEGAVRVILPPGVTYHTEAITRNETVVLKGRGEEVSTLRPSPELGPDEGVQGTTRGGNHLRHVPACEGTCVHHRRIPQLRLRGLALRGTGTERCRKRVAHGSSTGRVRRHVLAWPSDRRWTHDFQGRAIGGARTGGAVERLRVEGIRQLEKRDGGRVYGEEPGALSRLRTG